MPLQVRETTRWYGLDGNIPELSAVWALSTVPPVLQHPILCTIPTQTELYSLRSPSRRTRRLARSSDDPFRIPDQSSDPPFCQQSGHPPCHPGIGSTRPSARANGPPSPTPMKSRNMRFKRWPHRTQFEDTPRKRAALSRSQRKHRERFPLLAEIIAEVQPDADTVMNNRAYQWRRDEDNARQQRAEGWRRARERIAAYDSTLRHQVLNLWRTAPYPADPSYLHDFLRALENGRINPAHPPWIYRGTPLT
jgi:hypothetical protein